jgi:hypothetical protein
VSPWVASRGSNESTACLLTLSLPKHRYIGPVSLGDGEVIGPQVKRGLLLGGVGIAVIG